MKDATESRGQLILDVAKAASSHLDLSDVLHALMLRLKHTIRFDAIAVLVIEGDHPRLHELYTEISERKPGESLKNFVGRLHSDVKVPNTIDPVRPQLKDTHIGAVASSRGAWRRFSRPRLKWFRNEQDKEETI